MNRTEYLHIEQVQALHTHELAACDFSFDIARELNAPYQDLFDCRHLPVSRKDYGFDPAGWAEEASDRRALFRASVHGRLAGFAAISESWNGMAEIGEIAVDRARRRHGIAQRLLSTAQEWAKDQGFGFMRLETQSNNVEACKAYARAGFVLGGHDRFLYAGGDNEGEVALFWYKALGAICPGSSSLDGDRRVAPYR